MALFLSLIIEHIWLLMSARCYYGCHQIYSLAPYSCRTNIQKRRDGTSRNRNTRCRTGRTIQSLYANAETLRFGYQRLRYPSGMRLTEFMMAGTPRLYTDFAIITCHEIRLVYKLLLRQCQGFIDFLFQLMKIPLSCPDFSVLSNSHNDC